MQNASYRSFLRFPTRDSHATRKVILTYDVAKSPFYPVSAAATNGKYIYTLFSSIDENWHDKLRKSVKWIFTPTAAASYEPIVDNTLTLFQQVINKRFANEPGGGVLDLPQWALYFTFDVMGDLTYSRRYGFLEEARDKDGIIALMRRFLAYGFYVSGLGPLSSLHNRSPCPIRRICESIFSYIRLHCPRGYRHQLALGMHDTNSGCLLDRTSPGPRPFFQAQFYSHVARPPRGKPCKVIRNSCRHLCEETITRKARETSSRKQ